MRKVVCVKYMRANDGLNLFRFEYLPAAESWCCKVSGRRSIFLCREKNKLWYANFTSVSKKGSFVAGTKSIKTLASASDLTMQKALNKLFLKNASVMSEAGLL